MCVCVGGGIWKFEEICKKKKKKKKNKDDVWFKNVFIAILIEHRLAPFHPIKGDTTLVFACISPNIL